MKFDELMYKKIPAYVSILIFLIVIILAMLLAGCTVSLNNTQASGHARESFTESQTTDPQTSIPVKA
jgi:PBP1b-binding outer membrane lipoprotein LpoB